MHEMALCESILDILQEQAKAQRFSRVRTVRLEVGALSCVESEALRFNFEVVTRGSLAEGAGLELIEVAGEAWCLVCAQPVTVGGLLDACPLCGSHQTQVTGGDTLQIKELEVD
ncbi:hydrogenase maturation nickel metallochaperone HypA [Thiohalorhabdus methylotrophus]|uniref:Hydrogenase maturation factor HypA n=1 Tax=Thiohalorhabdus methylotrophus TaxID=3242694 RepID=A0ABV4TYE0_9GAMM